MKESCPLRSQRLDKVTNLFRCTVADSYRRHFYCCQWQPSVIAAICYIHQLYFLASLWLLLYSTRYRWYTTSTDKGGRGLCDVTGCFLPEVYIYWILARGRMEISRGNVSHNSLMFLLFIVLIWNKIYKIIRIHHMLWHRIRTSFIAFFACASSVARESSRYMYLFIKSRLTKCTPLTRCRGLI